jgi:hypothetical protein
MNRVVKTVEVVEADVTRFHTKYTVNEETGCWNWNGSRQKPGLRKQLPYGIFHGVFQQMNAHRYSWIIHNGQIPEKMVVMHTCDNPGCVNPDHLRLGTQRENMQDMYAKGRNRTKGRKLTRRQELMLLVFSKVIPRAELAKIFGVSEIVVHEICNTKRRQTILNWLEKHYITK